MTHLATRISFVGTIAVFILIAAGLVNIAAKEETPAVEVYFIAPSNGATVTSPVKVVFGLRGMGVAPAGVEKPGTGHHHLLIDRGPLSAEELIDPLPSDENHKHFGGGQTETFLELAPGTHTLQLVLGDHNHIPHDPPVMSKVITVEVQ